MDLIMTMFKPRTSMSPEKLGSVSPAKSPTKSPTKRASDTSPTRPSTASNNVNSVTNGRASKKVKFDQEPRFTFDEVKTMLDTLLTQKTKGVSANVGLKHVNFREIAVPGHSVQSCKELIEKLINMTRRIRTLEEVLTDIKTNLGKRAYTEAIQRATLQVEPPKKPPSAYLLYHRERFEALKQDIAQASEIAKIVSEEWKNLDDRRRLLYQKKHNEMVKKYNRDIKKLGLEKTEKPKRFRSAKALFIQANLEALPNFDDMDKDELAKARVKFAQEYDAADKEIKKHWTQQFEVEQERYRREQNEYMAAHPHLDHHVPENPRKARKLAQRPPQPPKSALKHFYNKKLPDGLEGQELDDAKQRLKEKFNRLSEKKQLKYIKKAIRDKERYDNELEEFKTSFPDVAIPKIKQNVTKEQWRLYQTAIENKPDIPAPTAYLHYCGKALTNNHDDSQVPTQRMQSASAGWSSLSEEEKSQLQREHIESIRSFIDQIESWLLTLSEARRDQVWREEPKCRPDYWRKRLAKMERTFAKRNKQ